MMTPATAPALTRAAAAQRCIAMPRRGEGERGIEGTGGIRHGFIIGIITEIF